MPVEQPAQPGARLVGGEAGDQHDFRTVGRGQPGRQSRSTGAEGPVRDVDDGSGRPRAASVRAAVEVDVEQRVADHDQRTARGHHRGADAR
ncbi:hypothetical protein ACWEQA_36070 [Nocardia sp. NPDC004085]|uniref:hypothetical protein n=1 Tax=Nocardia sp. NPDC019255 TaxID=3154591 RepID=UPI0033D7F390